jgi:hypothetical protein
MRGPSGPQARTVRTADRPASGPDRPLAQNGAQHILILELYYRNRIGPGIRTSDTHFGATVLFDTKIVLFDTKMSGPS